MLTCGKEEVTEEHVHGPGCFKTVTVRNSDGKIIEVDEDRANIEGMELMEEPEEEVEVQGEPADEVDEGSLEASAVDDEATDVAPTSDTTTSTEEDDADSGESAMRIRPPLTTQLSRMLPRMLPSKRLLRWRRLTPRARRII